MESASSAILELKFKVSELQISLDAVSAQNDRLSEENARLRYENNKLQTDNNISASVGIDSRMKLHRLESENEDLKNVLQEIKIKYNKLQDRYAAKERKEQALSQFYIKQNKMPFAVPKKNRASVAEAAAAAKRHSQEETPSSKSQETSSDEVAHLKTKLMEAYDIIDGLEFELESITFLECENERLRKQLESLKFDRGHLQDDISISCPSVSSDEARSSFGMNENEYESIDCSAHVFRPDSRQVTQEDTEIYVERRSFAEKKKLIENRLASLFGKLGDTKIEKN